MLTEAETKWLEKRLQNLKVSGWFSCTEGELIPLVNFHRKHLNSDWQDAAEFEARVIKEVINLSIYTDGCILPIDCPDMLCKACLLKYARISVEAEMEKETANKHL